jgi:hypothetical protein
VPDGQLGIRAALAKVFPQAEELRCWNHRIRNAIDPPPKKQCAEVSIRKTSMVAGKKFRRLGAACSCEKVLRWRFSRQPSPVVSWPIRCGRGTTEAAAHFCGLVAARGAPDDCQRLLGRPASATAGIA